MLQNENFCTKLGVDAVAFLGRHSSNVREKTPYTGQVFFFTSPTIVKLWPTSGKLSQIPRARLPKRQPIEVTHTHTNTHRPGSPRRQGRRGGARGGRRGARERLRGPRRHRGAARRGRRVGRQRHGALRPGRPHGQGLGIETTTNRSSRAIFYVCQIWYDLF